MLSEELMNDVSQIDDSRIIFFYAEEITLENSSVLIKELIRLDMESDDDIYLFLQTLGGDLYNSFAIYDTINSLKSKVNIVCFSTCYSGGVLIAAAGEKVYAFQHTDFLIHPVQLSFFGALDDLTHINNVSDKYADAISKELNISAYDFKIKYDKDVYLSAHDMLNAGIVDEIVTDLGFLQRKGVN